MLTKASQAVKKPEAIDSGRNFAALFSRSASKEKDAKADKPKKLIQSVLPEKSEPYKAPALKKEFKVRELIKGLVSPDGLAWHPQTGELFVSEEDLARVQKISKGKLELVLDNVTPIFEFQNGKKVRAGVLRGPEGIAFASNGDLYVVEDVPGGRLIRFVFNDEGVCKEGEVIVLPGPWSRYAWEGVDVRGDGAILVAGSDVESISQGADSPTLFSGAILFRDPEGMWWIPYQRVFSSYSSARFSKSGKQAIYTCEITGEVGWLDLDSHQPIGGNSTIVARSPEGICALPNGMLLIAQEGGSLVCLDPSTDKRETVVTGLGSIESVLWDKARGCAVVSADGSGKLYELTPSEPYPDRCDMMDFAQYHPIYSPQHIPRKCPAYLANVLAMGALEDEEEGRSLTNVSLREFTSRVPLIAANARATPVEELGVEDDPIGQVQFVVFNPNTIAFDESGPSMALAAFAAATRSGKIIRTSVMRTVAQAADPVMGTVDPLGVSTLAVPQPAAISVSSLGMATLHFLGLGKTPDYAISLDPRNPSQSYMVVFYSNGNRYQYRLNLPQIDENSDQWIIAYSGLKPDQWTPLGASPDGKAKAE